MGLGPMRPIALSAAEGARGSSTTSKTSSSWSRRASCPTPDPAGASVRGCRPVPPREDLSLYRRDHGIGPCFVAPSARALGFQYDCVDIDADFTPSRSTSISIHAAGLSRRYGLTTNHGTTEHVLNQSQRLQDDPRLRRTTPAACCTRSRSASTLEHRSSIISPRSFFDPSRASIPPPDARRLDPTRLDFIDLVPWPATCSSCLTLDSRPRASACRAPTRTARAPVLHASAGRI